MITQLSVLSCDRTVSPHRNGRISTGSSYLESKYLEANVNIVFPPGRVLREHLTKTLSLTRSSVLIAANGCSCVREVPGIALCDLIIDIPLQCICVKCNRRSPP